MHKHWAPNKTNITRRKKKRYVDMCMWSTKIHENLAGITFNTLCNAQLDSKMTRIFSVLIHDEHQAKHLAVNIVVIHTGVRRSGK